MATVPVVIVPGHWKPADQSGPVLVAVDDSDNNPAVIEFAIAAAAEWTENAERHLENLAAEWRQKHPELTIEAELRRGHAVDGIITAATESDAQLLVIGTHHHTRLTSFLLGSVTRGVLHHATCPLAVVPTPYES